MGTIENSKIVLNNCIKDISDLPDSSSVGQVTVYEVVRVIEGRILYLEDHLERFIQSFRILSVTPKQNENQIKEQLKLLIQANCILTGNIKFFALVDTTTDGQDFVFQIISHAYPTGYQYKNGVEATILKASRANPNAKVQNESLRCIADKMIKEKNVYEVILISPDGLVTEGSRSNIFMIKDGIVRTPRPGSVLPGVTRKNVIKACNSLNIKCIEVDITLEELVTMDAVFITGTSPKVLPVKAVDSHFFGVNDSNLRSIMDKFDEMTDNYIKSRTILL